jgi:hypothetical protein
MGTKRFKVGDVVIYAFALIPKDQHYQGSEATILGTDVYVRADGRVHDYMLDLTGTYDDGREFIFACDDWQLRPKNPPAEPKSLTRSSGESDEREILEESLTVLADDR